MDGVKWLVDVDVAGFFENIDHDILLRLLRKGSMTRNSSA
jgi:RNA-directed DNA polymerase